MRLFQIAMLVLLAVRPGAPLSAAERADPSWETLKSLAGDWEGTYEGQPSRVSYKLVSNGTALMETMSPDDHRMTRLVMTVRDRDHLTHEWTSRIGGQDHVGHFEFTRKK